MTRSRPALLQRGTNPSDVTAGERLVNLDEVLYRTALSRTTRWRLEKQGLFPKPFRISAGRVAWRQADIDHWISEKLSDDERNLRSESCADRQPANRARGRL